MSDADASGPRRAQIVGVGLIGGSVGLALRGRGWHVTGRDTNPTRAARALQLGALDAVGHDATAALTVVATPAGAVAGEAVPALAGGGVVTDVAGIKAAVTAAVDHPRFVGGHPMAGSEQEGLDGADADLFVGRTWVLTPTGTTSPEAYATVGQMVASLGATVVAVDPGRHDDLVALVSHVPHLTAATLMDLAADTALEEGTLLRLAAGGFRDMTRVAAGHPGIWPDICRDNRDAIVAVLDRLTEALTEVRAVVAAGDRSGLLGLLDRARQARGNLPVGAPPPDRTVEVRIPVPDRPGALAEVTTALGEVGVNIYDFEVAHSSEGGAGVLVLVVATDDVAVVRGVLGGRGYRLSVSRLDR